MSFTIYRICSSVAIYTVCLKNIQKKLRLVSVRSSSPSLLLPGNIHLPPHWVIVGCVLRLHHCIAVHLVTDRFQIDQSGHVFEKIRHLVSRVSFSHQHQNIHKYLTGFACQRLPEGSKNPRCPPIDVVKQTVYGFALNSSYGIASTTAICKQLC